MKKIIRFTILSFTYILLAVVFYSVIPTISWIFGGEFLAVAQHPMHVLFSGCTVLTLLGIVFSESFDSNFYSKKH